MSKLLVSMCLLMITQFSFSQSLPPGFVYLKDIDPSIIQEMRYASSHNFVGRPIKGYQSATCILTKPTALALKKIQSQLRQQDFSLKVYDCYRPVAAVQDFFQWSQLPDHDEMKEEFYPRTPKNEVFQRGYVAKFSGHSRGSTVDLAIVSNKNLQQASYRMGEPLKSCFAPKNQRFQDNCIDMGTGFDCLDVTACLTNKDINPQAQKNRIFLQKIMTENGFSLYEKEWWHFTLNNEPFPKTYFNFPVN